MRAVAAGARLTQIAGTAVLTSSFVRPLRTLRGWSSASQPSMAWPSRLWISSHSSGPPAGGGGSVAPGGSGPPGTGSGRGVVRTRVNRPRSFSPCSTSLSSPAASAAAGSGVCASGTQVPQSHTMTSPAPYWWAGMTPSKSTYSSGWSSTRIAIRRAVGSRDGPRGTAQLTSTPPTSRRRS